MSAIVEVSNENIPNILWAQSPQKIFLTILVSDSKNNTFLIKNQNLISFECNSNTKIFKFEFELDDSIKDYSMNITNRKITISIEKSEESWWMKLTDNPLYKNNIKVDWDRWQDEDDDDEVQPMMGGMESMMGGMGGMESMMGGMGGMEEMLKNMGGMEGMGDFMDEQEQEEDDDEDKDEDINTEGMTDMLSSMSELETVSKLNENENKDNNIDSENFNNVDESINEGLSELTTHLDIQETETEGTTDTKEIDEEKTTD